MPRSMFKKCEVVYMAKVHQPLKIQTAETGTETELPTDFSNMDS